MSDQVTVPAQSCTVKVVDSPSQITSPLNLGCGNVLFKVTIAVSEAVHPLAGLVTVTVYVPGAFAVIEPVVLLIGPLGPVQLNVALVGVMLVAVMVRVGFAQVSGPPLIVTVGWVLLSCTVVVADFLQPVAVTVTSTLYVPGTLTLKLDTFPGFVTPDGTVHAYVTPVFGDAVAVKV
jgi:hypothetical protein